jgi:hypothetical protein
MPGGVERYRAVVESTATVDFNGVLDRMRQQGSSLRPGEVLAAWPGLKLAVCSSIKMTRGPVPWTNG